MTEIMKKALKNFMKENFDFAALKKAGFYPKDMKHTDYEGQAKRVCTFFGFDSIYEWKDRGETRCHLTYAGERPLHLDKDGELKPEPFVTVVNENPMHI